MSLATTGGGFGGAGGGGIVLAHDANRAIGHPAGNIGPPPEAAESGHGLPPPSGGVLGADLMDKQQGLSLKQVKNVSHLPIVAIDLYASEPHVAYFPKKADDPSETVPPRLVGKMKSSIYLQASEAAHKTLRKYLTQSKTYLQLQSDSLSKSDDKQAVVLEKPQRWLGFRRLEDAPDFIRDQVIFESPDTPAIAEEKSSEAGVTFANSTLDGSQPQNDDFDRVVLKVRLSPAKKAVTVLPEEAVQILLRQAQYHVASKVQAKLEDEEILDYPCAIAIPAWASHDAAVEALYDATGDNAGVFYQRSVCALAGALLPSVQGKSNAVLERLEKVRGAMAKEYRRQLLTEPDLVFHDEVLLILLGMTDDGFEATAIQVADFQGQLATCLFTKFKVFSNVSYQSKDPLSKMEVCVKELEMAIEAIAPEADGPAGILTYGLPAEQEKMKKKWDEIRSTLVEWENIPLITTKSDSVCMGTAVLGAVSHGRQALLVEKQGGKVKAELGIQVHNVARVAVGVRINYHGYDNSKWTPIKIIFDFDRRIPAGPYAIELKASECVVHRSGKLDMSDEAFLKASKEYESSKYIPKREEAALALRVDILQKWTRDGEWKRVGDIKEPLVKCESDEDEKRIACESVTLELSLAVTGMITLNMVGERESVVQATKSARNSALRYYIGIILAVLFFGGFLVRSYWEEYTFKRDTKKLLAYYKHVIPGSISDGDEHNARYVVWTFRHKKKKLWSGLEKKYGIPVREAHEWSDYVPGDDFKESGGDDELNLDEANVDAEQKDPHQSSNSDEL